MLLARILLGFALGAPLAVLPQNYLVENRSGAGGNIGAEAVAKAGDPHVLLIGGNGPAAFNGVAARTRRQD